MFQHTSSPPVVGNPGRTRLTGPDSLLLSGQMAGLHEAPAICPHHACTPSRPGLRGSDWPPLLLPTLPPPPALLDQLLPGGSTGFERILSFLWSNPCPLGLFFWTKAKTQNQNFPSQKIWTLRTLSFGTSCSSFPSLRACIGRQNLPTHALFSAA